MINEIYYTTVVKQEAQELRNRATQDRLAREAITLRRRERAERREIEKLEHAVHGKPSWWALLVRRFGGRGAVQSRQRVDLSIVPEDQDSRNQRPGATTHQA